MVTETNMVESENYVFRSLLMILFSIPALSIMTDAESRLPVLRLITGGYSFDVEIASTFDNRNLGLMYRNSLPANHGMLFVFPEKQIHCMWMRYTNIPLSVAFLDEQGTIVNIEDMKPHTDDHHCTERPVRYAIEMQSGWFLEKGIVPGTQIEGLDKAPVGR